MDHMKVTQSIIKTVQESLNRDYGHSLVADGIAGKNTQAALLQIRVIPTHWDINRKLIGYIQHLCALNEIDAGPVDGYWGTQTLYGFEQLKIKLSSGSAPLPWRDDEGMGSTEVQGRWPVQVQEELLKYYGPVGMNQTLVTSPYPLKIAWKTDKAITKFSCHEKVADSIVRVLTRVVDHYGDDISNLGLDLFGGCLNVRKMRGGTKWSTHAWGIAIDWDPARNQLRWNCSRANFCSPIYDKWWDLWEEEGAVSLGRIRDYDHMHVQFARVA